MRIFLLSFLMVAGAVASEKSLHSFKTKDIDGKPFDFGQYKGKTLLIVNIATRCGFTGQLDGLQDLYKDYRNDGFVVIGVPSNDFGGQTPEGNQEVKKFCSARYDVTFPITEKQVVKGPKKVDFIRWLTNQNVKKKGFLDRMFGRDKKKDEKAANKEISWNFNKFLVDGDGKLVNWYGSTTKPSDKSLRKTIEKTL